MKTSIDDATPSEWDRSARIAVHVAQLDAPNLVAINAALERPFGDVGLLVRCQAFALWQQDHPIQIRTPGGGWLNCDPRWGADSTYRVLPKPEELVLPSIDWSHVGCRLKWLTQDESGVMVLFDHQPKPSDAVGVWAVSVNRGQHLCADNFASAKPGKGDWRKLIVQRPEGV